MTSTMQDRQQIEQSFQRLTEITTPEEAQAKLITAPAVMAYEARYALQTLRDHLAAQDPTSVFDVVEPLARAVGWAEGLAFAINQIQTPNVPTNLVGSTGKQ